jgi:hypothetical protein
VKRIALLLTVLALATTASFGATCTSNVSNVLTAGFSCTLGGLTFSNFGATTIQPGGGTAVVTTISLNTIVLPNGTIQLAFNPNLNVAAGSTADFDFFFTVTGGINQIDLTVGSAGAATVGITEVACTSAFNPTGSTTCPGTTLASISAGAGQSALSGVFATTGTVFISKDINVNNTCGGCTTQATFSDFEQSFHGTVPEPSSIALFGSGLLGLAGMVRRKLGR